MPAPGAAPTKKPAKSDRCSAVHVVESVVVVKYMCVRNDNASERTVSLKVQAPQSAPTTSRPIFVELQISVARACAHFCRLCRGALSADNSIMTSLQFAPERVVKEDCQGIFFVCEFRIRITMIGH